MAPLCSSRAATPTTALSQGSPAMTPLSQFAHFHAAPLVSSKTASRRTSRSVRVPRASAEVDQVEDAPAAAAQKITAPADFVAPEPKKFAIAPGQALDIATAAIPALFRLGTGAFTTGYSVKLEPASTLKEGQYSFGTIFGRAVVESNTITKHPEKPIVLYEFEGCPFCRKVREAASVLDLDVLYYPCPQSGPNFRPKAAEEGGKKQFPYMVDPNTGVTMYESDDIIKYLADTYGDGSVPLMLRLGILTTLTAGLGGAARMTKGSRYVPAKLPSEPLELWAYEASPFCKVVREALCELELPHVLHNTARGSANRDKLLQKTGRFQVPYLEDPNTGVKTFESKAIVDYLYKTYALNPPSA